MNKNILISENELDITLCRNFVSSDKNGAECIFIGSVRNSTNDKNVNKLHFECYASMAVKEMDAIAHQAFNKFDITAIAIHHRLGMLTIGDIPVIIAVGSPHRAAAFNAAQYAIDTLKETVPIWKKEFFDDGAVWVSAHP